MRSIFTAAVLISVSFCEPGSAQNPFLGGVPSGKATSETLSLSLTDAVQRGLKYNLGVLTAEQSSRAARASRMRSLSHLLPEITTRFSEAEQQVNLKALGFGGFPGIPTIIGPFGVSDARVYLSQPLLDFNAIRKTRAEAERLEAAEHSYQNARDMVILVVTGLYLQANAGSARIEAEQAQVNTASALYNQAADMKKAGVVPGIEVLRAQVELQAQQQRLIFVKNEFEKQKLSLARAIGLPPGQQFDLASQVPYAPLPSMTLEQALDQAYRSRSDYQSAQALVRAAQTAKSAAEAERYPSLSFDGNYGAIGPHPSDSHGTFGVAASLKIPVFQGGRVRAEVLEADARLEQAKSDAEDLRGQIDYQVRAAFLDLKASGDQVDVAKSSIKLADEQLQQARDRFGAGIADNIEVVQAQQAVATAQENYISALFGYNMARASLARALGATEQAAKGLLGVN